MLHDLYTPDNVKEQIFEAIQRKLKHHFTIVERQRFNLLKQTEIQFATNVFMKVRNQAIKCNFGSSMDDMLKDQLVIFIRHDDTRKRLLSNDNSTKGNGRNMYRRTDGKRRVLPLKAEPNFIPIRYYC